MSRPPPAVPGLPASSGGDGLAQGSAASARAASEVVQLCAFAVGGEEYVLDVMRISSIIRPIRVNAIPHAPPFVEGVLTLKGSIVPVIDLRRRLGVEVSPLGPKSRMIVAVANGREVALTVDRVVEVMRIPRDAIRAVPEILAAGGARFFLGVCDAGSPTNPRLRFLLNLGVLLSSTELPPVPPTQVPPTAVNP